MGRPRVVKKVSHNVDISQGKLGELAISDYSSTYVKHRNFNPTKSMRPKPAQVQPQYPAMEIQTTNMKTYLVPSLSAKRDLIKPEEKHLNSDEPLNTDTLYNAQYTRKSPLPVIKKRPETHADFDRGPRAKFDDRTMNKQFYKEWQYRQPQRFGELPSYTHSLIFPERGNENTKDVLCSRTQLDYPYKSIKKPSLIRGDSPNIKVGEGDHHHETTHRSTFKFTPGEPVQIVNSLDKQPQKSAIRSKMDSTTKYQADFPFKDRYPLPQKLSTPAPNTLEIKMDNRQVFETEQRKQFHGWDVNKHRRPDPAKISDNTERSDEPMVTETTTTRDFTEKDVTQTKVGPASRPVTNVKINKAKFRDLTMNRVFFQDWGTRKRLRYGDFHEACKELRNIPKVPDMFPLSSTTKSTYVKKTARPRALMKPDTKTIDTSLDHDFNTVTRMAYKYPPASAYLLEDFEVKC